MESWRRTLSQFRDLFNNMAPSQRMTLVVVPLLVLGALGLVMYMGVGPAEEGLLAGKSFTAEELKTYEAALQKAGFVQYRVEGQKILVPKAEIARYNAAVIRGAGVPDSFGDDLAKAIDANPLVPIGEPQRMDRTDLGKARELVKIFRSMDDVEDAAVVFNRGQKTLGRQPRGSAFLSVKP